MKFLIKNGNIVVLDSNEIKKLQSQGYYVHGKLGIIDPIEALFLIEEKNAKIFSGGNELGKEEIIKLLNINIKKYYAYKDLKKRGYNFSMKEESIILKNGEKIPFFLYYPMNEANFYRERGFIAIVDDDLDLTYFIYSHEDPIGNANENKKIIFIDDKKRILYEDLVERKFKMNSGLKFGTEFIAYENNNDEHSKYMVKILRPGMQWIEMAGLARVANGVRKKLLIAVINGKINYFSFSWFRA
ncbi:MAG: tRNA-intron lyase [Thermoplasmata archaeon]|nr:tRNA-intron lyase [Thermoplasmata archaeon]